MTNSDNLKQFLSMVPVESFESGYSGDITAETYFGFPLSSILEAEKRLLSMSVKSVGYFSMEFGLSSNTYNVLQGRNPVSRENSSSDHNVFSNLRAIDYYVSVKTNHRLDLPIYSGGLGVLAGDTLKSAADRGVPMAAVGILWNKGYFKQNFWFKDGQVPEENVWDPHSYPGLVPLTSRVHIHLKKETIHLRLWKYYVYSFDKSHVIPLILLDSNIPDNSAFTRTLTDQLYRSDNAEWKILQRMILGLGGMKAFDTLRYPLHVFHLNEGHAAFAFIEKARGAGQQEIDMLKNRFCYTCHTPVAAGHDRFQKKAFQDILPDDEFNLLKKFGTDAHSGDMINLTELAMNTSGSVNAVAQKHGVVTRAQFPHYADRIEAITNGVHTHTWVSESVAKLFDRYDNHFGGWRKNPNLLQKSLSLKDDRGFREGLWQAHQENKKNLCDLLKYWKLDPNVFTIAWARRIAGYKRPSLILKNAEKLVALAKKTGPIQIIFAGKAHPKDDLGSTHVNEMLSVIDSLDKEQNLRVLMLENYDTYFGKLLSNSVDVWLNNPLPPFEASGTSGMKAILNGVLQLSTLDGWVVEAADKNIGWIFGWRHESKEIGDERNQRLEEDSDALYEMLDKVVSLYYATNRGGNADAGSDWVTKMVHAVSEAGFFNTERMVEEYEKKIWKL